MCAASYVSPSYAATERRKSLPDAPIGVRWSHRKPLRRGSRTWKYLHDARALPETILGFARRADVLTEAPIDALSIAALENARTHTLYGSTGGGMGPATIREIELLVAGFAGLPGAVFLAPPTPISPETGMPQSMKRSPHSPASPSNDYGRRSKPATGTISSSKAAKGKRHETARLSSVQAR